MRTALRWRYTSAEFLGVFWVRCGYNSAHMRTLLKKLLASLWSFPLVLLGVTLLAYGLQLGRMGFYWDDWQVIFLARLNRPEVWWTYYLSDRPFSIWTYLATLPVLGVVPLRWQLFTILLRWLTALGMWLALRGVWQRRPAAVGWMALLFAVYPGFSQQSISVAYSQHFISYALFSGSLAAMVLAVRRPRRQALALTLVAGLAALVQMMTMEYFVGLELLRLPVLWFLLRANGERWFQTGRRVLAWWSPYALALLVFGVWRFGIFPRLSPDPNANAPLLLLNLAQNPWGELVRLAQHVLQDTAHLLLFAWLNPLLPAEIDLGQRYVLFSWALGAVTAALAAAYLLRGVPEAGETAADGFVPQALLLGGLGLLLGGFPVWSTDRQVIVGMWSDRFALGPMFGAAMLLPAAVAGFSPRRLPGAGLLAAVLALAVAAQVQTVNQYALNWEAQRSYYWQLYWRAPALKEGTIVLGNKIPFGLVADYSVGFALNTVYAPENRSTAVPYWFASAISRRGGMIEDFRDGLAVRDDLRTVVYQGSTSHGLVVRYKYGQSCLQVLSPADGELPLLSDDERELLAISHLGQIDVRGDTPPPAPIFGAEPVHDWCYFYQKAALAQQNEDWAGVAALYDEAQRLGLRPANGVEWAPFIVGLAHGGRREEAGRLSQAALDYNTNLRPYVCGLWEAGEAERTALGCP